MGRNVSPLIVMAGIIVVAVGILVWAGGLSWFGRLPGDIRIEHGNVRIYIPVVSMLPISAVATIVLSQLRYLFRP